LSFARREVWTKEARVRATRTDTTSHPDERPGTAVAARRAPLVVAVGLIVVALNLRIAIAAVSPVLADIQASSGFSSTVGGVLTTTPVICFGAFALLTPRLIRRFGMDRLLLGAVAVLTCGIVARLIPSVVALFAGTIVVGAAIAVANVLLPGLIKRDFPDRVGLLIGVYSMALYSGAALASGLTVPLEHALGAGWRPTLGLWAIPALVALIAWSRALRVRRTPARPAAPARRTPAGPAVPARPAPAGPGGASASAAASPARRDPAARSESSITVRLLWGDPVARYVAGFMGLQSLGYYAALAWLPTLLEDHGMAAGQAGWMLSFSSFVGMAASLATPSLARWVRPRGAMVVATIALCATGYLGLLADPVALSYVWMLALGAGQGAAISLALGYIVLRSPDSHQAAQLSTMAQGTGYLIASAGPFGLGLAHAVTGGWTIPMVILAILLVPELLAGLGASRERYILRGAATGSPTAGATTDAGATDAAPTVVGATSPTGPTDSPDAGASLDM
jgi:MFS transporter, CP family, cyanate transporter